MKLQDQQEGNGAGDTFYFARNGANWEPTSLFERKASVVYGEEADLRKSLNLYTCVYITIGSRNMLQLYSPNLFSQTFSIQ